MFVLPHPFAKILRIWICLMSSKRNSKLKELEVSQFQFISFPHVLTRKRGHKRNPILDFEIIKLREFSWGRFGGTSHLADLYTFAVGYCIETRESSREGFIIWSFTGPHHDLDTRWQNLLAVTSNFLGPYGGINNWLSKPITQSDSKLYHQA